MSIILHLKEKEKNISEVLPELIFTFSTLNPFLQKKKKYCLVLPKDFRIPASTKWPLSEVPLLLL